MAAPDRPGLLATVAGVLTLCGVTVRSATTMSDPATGMALLRFEVAPAFDRLPDWDRVRADLDGRPRRPARPAGAARGTGAPLRPVPAGLGGGRPAEPGSPSTTRHRPVSTVVEVRAPDRGPVLYRVAKALTGSGLTITCGPRSTPSAPRSSTCSTCRPSPATRWWMLTAERQLMAAVESAALNL